MFVGVRGMAIRRCSLELVDLAKIHGINRRNYESFSTHCLFGPRPL
jgi:hypothetical protein